MAVKFCNFHSVYRHWHPNAKYQNNNIQLQSFNLQHFFIAYSEVLAKIEVHTTGIFGIGVPMSVVVFHFTKFPSKANQVALFNFTNFSVKTNADERVVFNSQYEKEIFWHSDFM